MSRDRADRVAGWATAVGIGLIALMLTWLIGNRVTGLIWPPPVGPTVAFAGAVFAGGAATFVWGRRLTRR
jgi:hypothetical protein